MRSFLKKKIIFLEIYLLFALFSKVKEQNTDFSEYKESFHASNTFSSSFIAKNDYIKLEVHGDNKNINHVLSVYSDEGRTKRIQMAQSLNGIAKLCFKQSGNNNIYFSVECNQTCSGNVYANYTNEGIHLYEGEILNYYVNEQTTEMKFLLISNKNSQIWNAWARGQLDITTSFQSRINLIKKDNYYIINDHVDRAIFEVNGNSGDFINIGFIGYEKGGDYTEKYFISTIKILEDGPIITGYLNKDNFKKVCYDMEITGSKEDYPLFGTGIILTKIGYSYIMRNGVSTEGETFSNGVISSTFSSDQIKNETICFTFPPEDKPQFTGIKEIIFTYQLSSGTDNVYNIYEPQLSGVFYPRYILKNSKVAFIPHFGNGKFENITMNLFTINGFPSMTVVECENFPLCSLDDTQGKSYSPRSVNRFSSYSFKRKENNEYSPISKKQTLFIVKCKESEKTRKNETKYFDLMCGFGSLIYKDNEEIQLIEDHYFNQYALKGQKEKFRIKIKGESKIKKIFIDVITYTGDIQVNINPTEGTSYKQYTSVNKIYTSIKAERSSETLNDIIFTVTATTNAYYTVLYNFGRDEVESDSLITNELQTGITYLVTIDASQSDTFDFSNKIVKFANERYFDLMPIMVNFFSLNCEIEVINMYEDFEQQELKYQETKQFGRFVHDLVNTNEMRYYSSQLEYRIIIREKDTSNYKGNLCKLYASAIEVSTSFSKNSRDILISDNTPQQIMFGNNVTHVTFGYVHVDFNNDLLLKFDPQQVAQFKIRIYYEGELRSKGEEIIVANDVIYLNKDEWAKVCSNKKQFCYFQVDITLEKTKDIESPVLEFSIKSIASNFVTYLPKNKLKIDYIQNKLPQYYYTELGQDENGFVVTNFLRGSGKVYGKIVSKDSTEENANWRGKYRLPTGNELIEVDPFTKKMDFSTFDANCTNGCYLLLNVFSDLEVQEGSLRNYPYSIIVTSHSMDSTYKTIPIISVPIDEYVIGTVDPLDPSKYIYQFYDVWLNLDAKQVAIDFQCDSGGLFINVGFDRPTVNNASFSFLSNGTDSIYILTKEQILSKTGNKNYTSIKDFVLTIGVWTNSTDTVYTTPFAFIVRLENGDKNDIYRVNSDQKALCKTRKLSEKEYRCLYAIEYDFLRKENILFIYTSIQKKSAFFKLYANYINPIDYEMGKDLQSKIPSNIHYEYSSNDLNSDFLYISKGLKNNEYLLVSFESNEETVVELMSTFYIKQSKITPNPSTPQLFMGFKHKPLILNFPKDNMVMVNIRGISGSAEIYWNTTKNNTYYLKGRDDRLSITSDKPGNYHQLIINATSTIYNDAGFIFYLTYGFRAEEANFDSLILDRSVNYVYSESDLPIVYYAPINLKMKYNDYYEVSFSFNILENEENKTLTFYGSNPIEIVGFIVKEKSVFEAKLTPDLNIENQNKIVGIYDQALRTGFIRIPREKANFNKSNIHENEKPYIYLKIQKSRNFMNLRKYKRISLETSAFSSSSRISISEMSYQFGSFGINETKREFILRTNSNCKYMIIQFSCLSDDISIKIKDKGKLNIVKSGYGKTIYSLETLNTKNNSEILEITRNNNTNISKIEYFILQYTNSNETNYKYSIKDTKIQVKRKKNKKSIDYEITLKPVENYQNYEKVTYIVRSVYANRNRRDLGGVPKKPDLSLKMRRQNVKEFYNKMPNSKGDLFLEIKNITSDVLYFQVIAQIKDKENVEYLSYDLVNFADQIRREGSNRAFLIVALIVGIILLLLIIGLIITIVIFNNKNKDLLSKVNQVSFSDEDRANDSLLVE